MDKLYITGKLNESVEVSNKYGSGHITIPKNGWIVGILRPSSNESNYVYESCEIIAWTEEVPKHGYRYNYYIPLNIMEGDSYYEITMYYTLPSIDHIEIYSGETSIEEILGHVSCNALSCSFDQEIADLEV